MSEHAFAHGLLDNIHKTTPGGITRAQFTRCSPCRRVMTWAARAFFVALIVIAAIEWITR